MCVPFSLGSICKYWISVNEDISSLMNRSNKCENVRYRKNQVFCSFTINSQSKRKKFSTLSLREKCPNTELFLVRVFLYSDWIRRFTRSYFWSVFSPNTGKYGPEITRYFDTFHAEYSWDIYQEKPDTKFSKVSWCTVWVGNRRNFHIFFVKNCYLNLSFFQVLQSPPVKN